MIEPRAVPDRANATVVMTVPHPTGSSFPVTLTRAGARRLAFELVAAAMELPTAAELLEKRKAEG